MKVTVNAQFRVESIKTTPGGVVKTSKEFAFDYVIGTMSDSPPLPINLDDLECLNFGKHLMSKIRSESQGILFRAEV